ncbi:MAG: flippase-like domain-containing protein [Ilumatobacteraceae bacterium]|nr:flippase-like domain-containing protein [Ilumatobacteraceae bacterium]
MTDIGLTEDELNEDATLPPDHRDLTGSGATEEETRTYVRSPEDVLRIVVFAAVSLVLVGLTLWVEESIVGFEEDLLELLDILSPAVIRVVNGAAELTWALVGVAAYLVALSTRRYRLLGYMVAASIGSFAAMSGLDALLDRDSSTAIDNALLAAADADLGDSLSNGVVRLAQLTAMFIVIRPFVNRRWRTAGLVTIATMLLLDLLVSVRLPVDLFLAVPVGAVVGTGVLLAFGRPDRRPTMAAIAAGLRDAGLPIADIRRAKVDARGSTPYFATLDDGTGLFVKVLGGQERAADLLFRVYRFLRLKNVGDDRPFSSLRRTVEHEALVALMARDVGVRTPRLRGVVDVGADSLLLAQEMVDGSSLDGVEPDRVTDDLMRAVWGQVSILRRHRIAHRDLRRANVFVGSDGEPWLIDFGFSEIAVPDEILDADVAQMLASFAVVVGAPRAVAAAVAELGTDAVGQALPRLQMKALSGATQEALKAQGGLLKEIQAEVQRQCGVGEVHFAELERIDRKRIFLVAILVAATYFLFPQFADLPGIVDQVSDAEWGWTPLILLGSLATYVGAAIALAGAVPARLPAGPTFTATLGGSFASKLAPAGLGGMALNVRYLQKQGVDEAVAVSGVGLNTIAGLAGHLSLVGVFFVWAGRDAFGSFSLPDPKWFLIGAGIALAVLAVGLLFRSVRAIFIDRLLPIVRRAFDGVTDVLRRPGKVAMLLGGSILVTFAYLTTLFLATQAFGGGLAFATVGAVYLVGSAVATAAPTPGGLGAMEAALIGGLVAAGLDNTIAVPAVFMYRLFTFWVPILPGWLCFQWLQRREYL